MKIAGPSVLSVMLCLSPAALADDAAIGALLERMEAAVLAGDPGAYLECVDKSHAEWPGSRPTGPPTWPGTSPRRSTWR
jgi:hypothetical protein